ncbi:hypothetical protein [Sinorhizobium meliloti]|nr:hypothetical protein [Sinorhizobium meliloti]
MSAFSTSCERAALSGSGGGSEPAATEVMLRLFGSLANKAIIV